jgi:sugar phosphate isomerase/epimerase
MDDPLNLLSVLEAIADAGFTGVGGFLEALLSSADAGIQRRVARLAENNLPTVVIRLLEHPRFGGRKAARNQELVAYLNSWVVDGLM